MSEVEARFWSKGRRDENTGCLIWTGGKTRGGYGTVKMRAPRRQVRAHRQAWIFARGPIPRGLNVLHTCDVPPCIEPLHLWLGTQKQNNADKVAKGRARGRCSGMVRQPPKPRDRRAYFKSYNARRWR